MPGCHVSLGPDPWFWLDTHPPGPWNHLERVAFSQSSSEKAEEDLGSFWTGSRLCGVPRLCFGVKRWHLTPHPEDGDFGCDLILGDRMTSVPEAEILGSESNKTLDRAGVGGGIEQYTYCPSNCHLLNTSGASRWEEGRGRQTASLTGQEAAKLRLLFRPGLLGAQGRCWLLQGSPRNEAAASGRQAKWGLCL